MSVNSKAKSPFCGWFMLSPRLFKRFTITFSTSWLCLVAFVLAILPVPLSTSFVSQSAISERFPCEKCACGCKTADKCWRACCCHSHAEKLAWAKKNNVEPPDFVVAVAKKEQAERIAPVTGLSTRSCCVGKSCSTTKTQSSETKVTSKSKRFVIVIDALKCQGHSFSFNVLPFSTIPDRSSLMIRFDRFFYEGLPWFSSYEFGRLEPPTPPPKAC